jgi:hypothetical protein
MLRSYVLSGLFQSCALLPNLFSDVIEDSTEKQRLLLENSFAVARKSDLRVGMLARKVGIRP